MIDETELSTHTREEKKFCRLASVAKDVRSLQPATSLVQSNVLYVCIVHILSQVQENLCGTACAVYGQVHQVLQLFTRLAFCSRRCRRIRSEQIKLVYLAHKMHLQFVQFWLAEVYEVTHFSQLTGHRTSKRKMKRNNKAEAKKREEEKSTHNKPIVDRSVCGAQTLHFCWWSVVRSSVCCRLLWSNSFYPSNRCTGICRHSFFYFQFQFPRRSESTDVRGNSPPRTYTIVIFSSVSLLSSCWFGQRSIPIEFSIN